MTALVAINVLTRCFLLKSSGFLTLMLLQETYIITGLFVLVIRYNGYLINDLVYTDLFQFDCVGSYKLIETLSINDLTADAS
jgi:hypothetical protein